MSRTLTRTQQRSAHHAEHELPGGPQRHGHRGLHDVHCRENAYTRITAEYYFQCVHFQFQCPRFEFAIPIRSTSSQIDIKHSNGNGEQNKHHHFSPISCAGKLNGVFAFGLDVDVWTCGHCVSVYGVPWRPIAQDSIPTQNTTWNGKKMTLLDITLHLVGQDANRFICYFGKKGGHCGFFWNVLSFMSCDSNLGGKDTH